MLNKNNTFQVPKKCSSSAWKCIYINTQAVNIYSNHANMFFQNLQARKKLLLARWSCSSYSVTRNDPAWENQPWRVTRSLQTDKIQKSVRKQPKCQSQKEQYNKESLERKSEYPPQAVLQTIFLTLPTGIILQVFMNTNISSTFPSYQSAGSHGWCQAAEELSAEPSAHRRHRAAHPLQCSVLSKTLHGHHWTANVTKRLKRV